MQCVAVENIQHERLFPNCLTEVGHQDDQRSCWKYMPREASRRPRLLRWTITSELACDAGDARNAALV
jgi:hypothetical protein